jgi:predicted RNase H-like nuclease
MERDFQTFVGVDLGGGKGKNTAVARLARVPDGGVRVVFVDTRDAAGQNFYDAALIDYLAALPADTLLAIDAPLLPSVCLRCRLPRCSGVSQCEDPVVAWFREHGPVDGVRGGKPAVTTYTQRACELVLARRHGILPRETLGQGMGPLTARAHYLRRALERRYQLNGNLLEVYPKASIHALFGALAARRYKRHTETWRTRAQMLEQLAGVLRFEVWREGCLNNDHCFDAVICAYTGFLWASQSWQLPEQDRAVFEQDGWIWFPPIPEP